MSRFDAAGLSAFTRQEASAKALPRVRRVGTTQFVYDNATPDISRIDALALSHLPPESDLIAWRSRLSHMRTLATQEPLVVTDAGVWNLSNIRNAIKLHEAKAIQSHVVQEIDWFNQSLSRSVINN